MTRRIDNDQWCLPGGGMEPGESAAECCIREVMEETGLMVTASRLIGIYTTPHRIMVYSEHHRFQFVSMLFEAIVTGGQPGLSDETSEIGFFTRDEISRLDLMVSHIERIPDVFAVEQAAFVR
jgi:8-oxo-dGTP pyrophosphatase MutT (NUDIX family)